MKQDIKLIPVTGKDMKILWEWRNYPEVRKNFLNTNPILWEEHELWFNQSIKTPDVKIYIATYKSTKIGVIRYNVDDKNVRVSVNLIPEFFGKGFGTILIKKGTKKFLRETKSIKPVIAQIKKDNVASQRAFAKAGYKMADSKENEVTYIYK